MLHEALHADLEAIAGMDVFDEHADFVAPLLAQVPLDVANAMENIAQSLHATGNDEESDEDCEDASEEECGDACVEEGLGRQPVDANAAAGADGGVSSAAGSNGDGVKLAGAPPLETFNLRQTLDWSFFRLDDGRAIGKIHAVGTGGLKGTCRVHQRCVLWLSCASRMPEGENAIVRWFGSAATDQPVDASSHADLARDIKISFGMCVRQRR